MATEHIVKSYDEELKRLREHDRRAWAAWPRRQLADAHPGRRRARHRARRRASSRATPKVDELEREIDDLAIRLLALRQPMARDLRAIVAALKIASDLERIGDYAANVAKRAIALAQIAAGAAGPRHPAHGPRWCRR